MRDPAAAPRVLVAEDDASMRRILEFNLVEEGFEVHLVERGDDAIALLTADPGGLRPSTSCCRT